MDLSNLSIAELKNLLNQIPAEIKRREKSEKANALKELEALAAERGFSLDELLGEAKGKKERGPVAVKYQHPEHPELQWSGRGRQPRWVAEFLNNGGELGQLTL